MDRYDYRGVVKADIKEYIKENGCRATMLGKRWKDEQGE